MEDMEAKLFGVIDSVLNDPFDEGHVEVTGDDGAFGFGVIGVLVGVSGAWSTKTEFEF